MTKMTKMMTNRFFLCLCSRSPLLSLLLHSSLYFSTPLFTSPLLSLLLHSSLYLSTPLFTSPLLSLLLHSSLYFSTPLFTSPHLSLLLHSSLYFSTLPSLKHDENWIYTTILNGIFVSQMSPHLNLILP